MVARVHSEITIHHHNLEHLKPGDGVRAREGVHGGTPQGRLPEPRTAHESKDRPMSKPRLDPLSVAIVLAGVIYPARTWRLLAQADHYGAGESIRAALARLPDQVYPSLTAVLATLELIPPTPPSPPHSPPDTRAPDRADPRVPRTGG
jgi:hypothetical protein